MAGAQATKPEFVTKLEAVYGPASEAGFGSAVFYEPLAAGGDLDKAALAVYRRFVGELWERFGEDAWMGPWKMVYHRAAKAKLDLVKDMEGLTDLGAAQSVPLLIELISNAIAARAALAAAFDDPAVSDLRVYTIGDGGAMSGVLVAGHRAAAGTATYVVALMD